ncbi:MAG: sulfatase [bacterium]
MRRPKVQKENSSSPRHGGQSSCRLWRRFFRPVLLELAKSVPAVFLALAYVYGLIVYSSRVIVEGYEARLLLSGACVFILCRAGAFLLSRLGKRWSVLAYPAGVLIMAAFLPLLRLPSNYPGPSLLPSFTRSPDTAVSERARVSNRRIKLDYEVREGMILYVNHSIKRSLFLPPRAVLEFGAGIEASTGSPPFHLAVYLQDPPDSRPRKVYSSLLDRESSRWEDIKINVGGKTRRRALLSIQVTSTAEEKKKTPGKVYISGLETSRAAEGASRPNIVIIVVDTWRPDHLLSYGYRQRETDPFLKRFYKKRGIKFKNCTSPSSWTTPAVASLFTSRYPAGHGVWDVSSMVLNNRLRVLPEILREHGYNTRAYSLAFPVSPSFNFSQGFTSFHDLARYMFHWDGDMVAARRVERYLNNEPEKPFFIYLHLMNPHYPYNVRPFFKSSSRTWNESLFVENALRSGFVNQLQKWLFPDRPWKEEELRENGLLEAYDREIWRTDRALKRIIQALDDTGLMEDTLLVITGDHGEEFKEHGGFYHKTTLYQEQVHVPLFLFGPGIKDKGASVSCPVSLVDIMPSVLESAGIKAESGLSGVSLWPILEGRCPDRPIYAELDNRDMGGALWEAVYEDRTKLIRVSGPGAESRTMLFDLEQDPAELHSLDTTGTRAERLEEQLHYLKEKRTRTRQKVEKVKLRNKQKRTLRSLGYLD